MKPFVAFALAISISVASSISARSEPISKTAATLAEAPAASWATYVSGWREGVLAPGILPIPTGGFYLYSTGDRPIIKFNAEGSIAWEVRLELGTNDVREIIQMDLLDNGDILAIVGANSNPRLFGQQFVNGGRFLVELRSADASPVFVKDIGDCWITALKAKPGGGYFLGGYTLGTAPRIGGNSLPITTNNMFIAQFTEGFDWAETCKWFGFSDSIRAIRTSGAGAALRIWNVGDVSGAAMFGEKSIDQPGVFMALLDQSGTVLNAMAERPYETTDAFSLRPSGGAYLASENQDRACTLSRLDANGAIEWTVPIAGNVAALTASDEPFVSGTSGDTGYVMSLDGLGNIKWTKGDPSRSLFYGGDAEVLADGRLAICGETPPSGIFIDDFFLRDFNAIQNTYYGAYVATLEIGAGAKPVFRVQPRSQKLAIRGENVTLHSEVFSPTPFTERWFKSGVLIPNQTGTDLTLPNAQAADSASYFAEAQNSAGVTRSAVVDVVVNSVAVSTMAGADSPGAFVSPRSLVALPDGSVLVADAGQNQIKRVTAAGVTTFAGTGGAGLANGAATNATFSQPSGLAFEFRYDGPIVYVADAGNNLLRRIILSENAVSAVSVDSISSVAGFKGPTTVAALDGLRQVFLDSVEPAAVWMSDEGNYAMFAATNSNGAIAGIALDERANVYYSDSILNNIRRITPTFDTQIFAQGLNGPAGMAFAENGDLYVVEKTGSTIRKISPSGTKSLMAGVAGASGLVNGSGAQALFNAPEAICFRNGNLVVADTGNHCLREITFTPLSSSNPGDVQLQVTFDASLSLSVSGGANASFAVESSAQLGPNAQWQNEGTVSANSGQGLSLSKPKDTRFYRARQLP